MKTLIPAQKQTVWGWPAVVNFSLGGAGTGLYLVGALLASLQGLPLPWPVALGSPALAALGLAVLTLEAGRPLRGLHLLRHLRRSWISREALAAAFFIPIAVLDGLLPHPALRALAVLAAAALLVSQGFILYGARGVTAWNVPLMPWFFVTSGLSAGAGLLSLVAPGQPASLLGLLCGAANLAAWLAYLRLPGADFVHATRTLRTPHTLTVVVGIGHLVPLALLGITLGFAGASTVWAALAGAGLVLGATAPKAAILLKAGYLRPIRLSPAVHRARAAFN